MTARTHQPLPAWQQQLAWLTIGLATLVGMFDGAVNVAFPAITGHFQIATGDIQWIITLYVLSQTSLTIIFGKVADRYGYRIVFQIGLAVAAAALLACALSERYDTLVVFRFAQGVGVGLILAVAPAMASFLLPVSRRREALGYYATWLALGLALGPLLGGHLVAHGDWPAVFWARVPVALVALALCVMLPRLGLPPQPVATAPVRLTPPDWPGALWLVLSMAALVSALVQWRTPMFGSGLLILSVLLTPMATWCFVRASRRAADPILPVNLLSSQPFRRLQCTAILLNLAAFSVFLLIPFLLNRWDGVSLVGAGYLLAAYPIGMMIAGLLAARFSARTGARTLLTMGIVVTTVGLCMAAGATGISSLTGLAVALMITGLGHGTFQVGHLDATMAYLSAGERGVAGAIAGVSRLLGIVLAANLLVWVHEYTADVYQILSHHFAGTFLIAALVGLASLLLLFTARRQSALDSGSSSPDD